MNNISQYSKYQRLASRCGIYGFTLIELMISIAIGAFLILGLTTLTSGTQASYGNQSQLSQLSEQQRFAITAFTNAIQTAGNYSISPVTNNTVATVFPVQPSSSTATYGSGYAAGQTVSSKAGNLVVRFEADAGYAYTLNCLGVGNTGGTNAVMESAFSVSGGKLGCQTVTTTTTTGVSTGTAAWTPLIDNVTSMTVLYGVDTGAATACSANLGTCNPLSVTQYVAAANMTTAAQWLCVMSMQVTLVFTNPASTITTVVKIMSA